MLIVMHQFPDNTLLRCIQLTKAFMLQYTDHKHSKNSEVYQFLKYGSDCTGKLPSGPSFSKFFPS